MPEIELQALSPFAGLQALVPGVQSRDRDGCGVALCTVRSGRRADFANVIAQRYGIELPGPGRCAHAGDLQVATLAPDTWLLVKEASPNAFADELRQAVKNSASVVDQSDGYALLRLSGASVPRLIAAGASIDTSELGFPVDRVATTQIAHITVTIWRRPDEPNGEPAFEFCVPRSFAASFWEWLHVHTQR